MSPLASPMSSISMKNADSLAEAIDRQVYTNYKLFPSNIIACQILGYTQDLD